MSRRRKHARATGGAWAEVIHLQAAVGRESDPAAARRWLWSALRKVDVEPGAWLVTVLNAPSRVVDLVENFHLLPFDADVLCERMLEAGELVAHCGAKLGFYTVGAAVVASACGVVTTEGVRRLEALELGATESSDMLAEWAGEEQPPRAPNLGAHAARIKAAAAADRARRARAARGAWTDLLARSSRVKEVLCDT